MADDDGESGRDTQILVVVSRPVGMVIGIAVHWHSIYHGMRGLNSQLPDQSSSQAIQLVHIERHRAYSKLHPTVTVSSRSRPYFDPVGCNYSSFSWIFGGIWVSANHKSHDLSEIMRKFRTMKMSWLRC